MKIVLDSVMFASLAHRLPSRAHTPQESCNTCKRFVSSSGHHRKVAKRFCCLEMFLARAGLKFLRLPPTQDAKAQLRKSIMAAMSSQAEAYGTTRHKLRQADISTKSTRDLHAPVAADVSEVRACMHPRTPSWVHCPFACAGCCQCSLQHCSVCMLLGPQRPPSWDTQEHMC